MKIRRSHFLLLSLATLVPVVAGCPKPSAQNAQKTIPLPEKLAANRVMSEQDFKRVSQIEEAATAKRKVAADDAAWLLGLVRNDGRFAAAEAQPRMILVGNALINVDSVPDTQRAALFDLAARMVRNEATDGGSRMSGIYSGIALLGKLKDKRAIPLIKPYLTSSDATLRSGAQKSLQLINQSGSA